MNSPVHDTISEELLVHFRTRVGDGPAISTLPGHMTRAEAHEFTMQTWDRGARLGAGLPFTVEALAGEELVCSHSGVFQGCQAFA